MPFPIITIGLSAAVFVFIQNIYVQMVAYAFLAINTSMWLASRNLIVGLITVLAFCILPPFSLAYKIFLFGLVLAVARGNLQGTSAQHIDTIGGIALLVGAIMGLYNFFAH